MPARRHRPGMPDPRHLDRSEEGPGAVARSSPAPSRCRTTAPRAGRPAPMGKVRRRRGAGRCARRGHHIGGVDLAHPLDRARRGRPVVVDRRSSVALVLALLPVDAPERPTATLLARLALAAEVAATGVPGGLLDQMASLHGRAGHALLLDCRALTVEPVPIPPELAILVVHSGIERELADSEYAARRAACETAAARIGVPALRDATAAEVADDPIARHVVSENATGARVRQPALRAGDLDRVGADPPRRPRQPPGRLPRLARPSSTSGGHFVDHGALGARLTGAGFGGCVVGLAGAETAAGLPGGHPRRPTAAAPAGRPRDSTSPRAVAPASSTDPGPPGRDPRPEFPAQGRISHRRCNRERVRPDPGAPARGSEDDRSARNPLRPPR